MSILFMIFTATEHGQIEHDISDDMKPVEMLLAVQPTQDAHLFMDVPEDWLEFEVQIQGWVPIKCFNPDECASLNVYADPFCDTVSIRITGLKKSGAFQHWQQIPCVDVPSLQPILMGQDQLPFVPPRRKWQ